jgi:LPS O-antigen subunit length determinant protein (WzzB/FepE family)
MADSQGDRINENSAATGKEDKAYLEEEINLIDCFVVLWKRKYFIFLATILPTLIVGITLFLWPKNYTVTYVYDVKEKMGSWDLNGKNYTILLDRFYSEENLNKLIDNLRKNKLAKYAEQLSNSNDKPSNSNDKLSKLVAFEVLPSFVDLAKLSITDSDQLNKIREMEALLLNVTITGNSMQDMYKLSSVIRDNIENIIPLYVVQERLSTTIRDYNNKMADIERERFNLELNLKNSIEVLTELKRVNTSAFDNKQEGVVLQFNVGEKNQYLPLNYQIQAAESKKISLEGSIKANEGDYEYYKDLLNLNNRILADLGNKLSDYRIEQFKAFLVSLAASYEKPQLKDYLNSCIRRIENSIAASRPITEKPKIRPVAKGTIKKSGVVFVIAFIVSVFSAFLREGFEKDGNSIS